MTTWNYRLIRSTDVLGVEPDIVAVHEVHYDAAGTPVSCTENPVAVSGENREDVIEQLQQMLEAARKPIYSSKLFERCWCSTCRPISLADTRMVLCPTCGNKRCPHAADHRNPCTNSNEPGQPGSNYP